MEFRILCRLKLKSILLPIALEVGRHKAEGMLIMFRYRHPKIKSPIALHYLSSKVSREHSANSVVCSYLCLSNGTSLGPI